MVCHKLSIGLASLVALLSPIWGNVQKSASSPFIRHESITTYDRSAVQLTEGAENQKGADKVETWSLEKVDASSLLPLSTQVVEYGSAKLVTQSIDNVARSVSVIAANQSNILDFGAKCDGTSHPLSENYATLSAAQVVFPQAAALTDETDTVAVRLVLAKRGSAFAPRTAGCMIGDLVVSGTRFWGNNSTLIPAPRASRMIQVSGYAASIAGFGVKDNGNLVSQSTLAAAAAVGDTSITVAPLSSGPPIQVGQRISLRLNAGTHFTTWVTSVTAASPNIVVGLRDPIPDKIIVAAAQATFSAGTVLAAAGNSFWSTFGVIHITNADRFDVENIAGVNIWGGINTDTAAPGAGNPGAARGTVRQVRMDGARMFGLIKGRNASDDHFSDFDMRGGWYVTSATTGDGSTRIFSLSDAVNLTRELSITVADTAKTAGTDFTIAANGLSVIFASAPASGAAIAFGFQTYGDDGVVDDGRDTTRATGGNSFNNVSSLQFRRCAFMKGAALYAWNDQSILDTCSETAMLVDGVSQVGTLNALLGWASYAPLWVTNSAAGLKAQDVTLAPQGSGYSVSGITPQTGPVVDSGSDFTGRVYNKGAGFADWINGLQAHTVTSEGVENWTVRPSTPISVFGRWNWIGKNMTFAISSTGSMLGWSGCDFCYLSANSNNSVFSLQTNGANGQNLRQATGTGTPLIQDQAGRSGTIKQTIGTTDMLTTDANGIAIPKLSAAPLTAPGVGKVRLFILKGTIAGTCKIMAQAGTSITASVLSDNIGRGC